MLKINKKEEPEFFSKFKKKEKPKNWGDFDFRLKNELKEYMLENEQKIGKEKYCPYCELKILLENSQIEHLKPKDKFPESFSNYENFIVGCVDKKTCGQAKGNKWDRLFINPVMENPQEYFSYRLRTGEIIPKIDDGLEYKKAIKTIEILNLNERKLCDYRKVYINQIINISKDLKEEEKIEIIEYFDEFPTLKEFLIENIEILKF